MLNRHRIFTSYLCDLHMATNDIVSSHVASDGGLTPARTPRQRSQHTRTHTHQYWSNFLSLMDPLIRDSHKIRLLSQVTHKGGKGQVMERRHNFMPLSAAE